MGEGRLLRRGALGEVCLGLLEGRAGGLEVGLLRGDAVPLVLELRGLRLELADRREGLLGLLGCFERCLFRALTLALEGRRLLGERRTLRRERGQDLLGGGELGFPLGKFVLLCLGRRLELGPFGSKGFLPCAHVPDDRLNRGALRSDRGLSLSQLGLLGLEALGALGERRGLFVGL